MFITGAASGIGRALAFQVAEEDGARHLTDLQAERLAEVSNEVSRRGGEVALAEPADVSSWPCGR